MYTYISSWRLRWYSEGWEGAASASQYEGKLIQPGWSLYNGFCASEFIPALMFINWINEFNSTISGFAADYCELFSIVEYIQHPALYSKCFQFPANYPHQGFIIELWRRKIIYYKCNTLGFTLENSAFTNYSYIFNFLNKHYFVLSHLHNKYTFVRNSLSILLLFWIFCSVCCLFYSVHTSYQ